MPEIAYTVTAECDSQDVASKFVSWLVDGHLQGVLQGGAHEARIVELDGEAPPVRIEVRYLFESRGAFERYERDHAPALRAEGLEKFGPGSGIRMSRSVGQQRASLTRGRAPD